MLYVLADEQRSALGPRRPALIDALPATASLVEMDCGHTVHRDRFEAYLSALLAWVDDA